MAEFVALPIFTDAITADCSHLSDEEFGRYMRLLIIMWRSPGCRIPNDPQWVCKRLRIDPLQYHAKVKPIIDEFCTCNADAKHNEWIMQKRLSKEYEHVKASVEKRKAAAQKRWGVDNKGKNDKQSISNADAPTPTPTPTNIPTNVGILKADKKTMVKPDDVSQSVWDDFIKLRGVKKAPVTETVVKLIRSEASKIGWSLEQALSEACARGWKGFKSEWVLRDRDSVKLSQNMKNLKDIHENGW